MSGTGATEQDGTVDTRYTRTAEGDEVAFSVFGAGPTVIFIAGAGHYRAVDPTTISTARLLAERGLEAIVYDRLGRGESAASGEISVARELSAIERLMDVADGEVVLNGHSSGGAIALAAAESGLPVLGLSLFEPPLSRSAGHVAEWRSRFERALDGDDLESAQAAYMADMPDGWLQRARASHAWPHMVESSPSLRADAEARLWATRLIESGAVSRPKPTILSAGEAPTPGSREAARRLLEALGPEFAEVVTVPGAAHRWQPAPMADLLHGLVSRLRDQEPYAPTSWGRTP